MSGPKYEVRKVTKALDAFERAVRERMNATDPNDKPFAEHNYQNKRSNLLSVIETQVKKAS